MDEINENMQVYTSRRDLLFYLPYLRPTMLKNKEFTSCLVQKLSVYSFMLFDSSPCV